MSNKKKSVISGKSRASINISKPPRQEEVKYKNDSKTYLISLVAAFVAITIAIFYSFYYVFKSDNIISSLSKSIEIVTANSSGINKRWQKKCFYGSENHIDPTSKSNFNNKCIIQESRGGSCGGRVVDGLFSEDDITRLHAIASKGLARRAPQGGPTILDINTGYIRDISGLENLFASSTQDEEDSAVFSAEDFGHYGRIIRGLRQSVANSFGLDEGDIFFTAPTFITRIDESARWTVQGVHDEYWHLHVDMNNTAHYHYSGLLYMSTYQKDFQGGRLKIFSARKNLRTPYGEDDEDLELVVEPSAGRVVIFSSGPENPHLVERVTQGERLVLSFWFTCDPAKEFEIFLDGRAHTAFSRKMANALRNRKRPARTVAVP